MYRLIDTVSIDITSTKKYHACSKVRKESRMAVSTLIGEVGDIRPSSSFTSYSLELVDWSRVSPRRTGSIASLSPDSC